MKKIFSTALVALLIIISTAASVEAISRDQAAEEILHLVNVERRKAGVPALKLSRELYRPAMIRAREIIKSFSHTRPNGLPFSSVFYGISYKTVGENLAAGQTSCEMVVQQWMDSPGHRANILNKKFKFLGVAYIYDGKGRYKHYWVQEFKG
ncbi:MAG: CAP domain-containing protein [Selenomonadaceae bacterium]|nr:CAP domain-containing protein [Selenomonadaceae bacterium]MBR1580911.1 CAP domain-containing protein [Selenomonadaceae bacterium]